MIRFAVVTTFMLALLPTGLARASGMDGVLNLCSNEDSHAGMRACLEKKASQSEAELMSAEDKLLEHISKRNEDVEYIQAMKKAYQSSKQSFSDYKDKQCRMYSSMAAGGNASGDLRLACVAVLDEMQIEQLDWMSTHWK